MEKDQIIILENRGLISISGTDAKVFLQNIVSNDVNKVDETCSVFSAIFTPQGKYLYEFFIIKIKNEYLLDCNIEFTEEIIEYLSKYKLRSIIEIKDLSSEYIIGIFNEDTFKEIQIKKNKNSETFEYRESIFYIDPRIKRLGARIICSLEKLHLIIKKLDLKIINKEIYLKNAHTYGVPIIGTKNLKDQLFGLEANFEELNAIDFKKGCYIGQENTARMKLKNKLRRRLMSIKSDELVKVGDELLFNGIKVGKVLIGDPYPFALIKLFDPEFSDFKDEEILVNNKKVRIINNY